MRTTVKNIIGKYNNDKTRLMDILLDTQNELGFIPSEAVEVIAEGCGLSKVDVEQTRSFYHFFTCKPVGEYAVYLNDSVIAKMMGRDKVAKAFEKEAGCTFGNVSDELLRSLLRGVVYQKWMLSKHVHFTISLHANL